MRIQADEGATGPARAAVPRVVVDRLTDVASPVVAIGVVVVSLAGLLWRAGHLYPPVTGTVLVSRAGDLANLAVTASALLATQTSARRGSTVGLLLWPGALFYAVYVYTIYAFAAPFSPLIFAYVAIALVSAVTVVRLLAGIPREGVARSFSTLPARGVGLTLVAISAAAYAGLIGTGLTILNDASQLALRPQWVVDCLLGTPALLAAGALLWRRHPFGYLTAPGAVFVSGVGGLAYVVAAALDPVLTDHQLQPAVIGVHLAVTAVDAALLTLIVRHHRPEHQTTTARRRR